MRAALQARPRSARSSARAAMLVLAALALQPAGAAAATTITLPPKTTWEQTPVFWHSSNRTGPLSPFAVDFLKRHNFSVITLEKNTMINVAPVADKAEQKIVAQARLLKKAGVTAPILQYTCSMGWNLAPDEGGYSLYNDLPDHLWLRNANNKTCTLGHNWKIFDLSQPEMIQRWLAMAQTAKDSGVIDGLFVDCGRPVGLCALPPAKSAAWYAGHEQLMQSMQRIFTNPDGSKGVIISNGGDHANVSGRMQEGFLSGDSPNGSDRWNPLEEISIMQEEDKAGRYLESHGYGNDPFGAHANHSKAIVTNATLEQDWAQQLSAFLVGAGPRSYFYASNCWTSVDTHCGRNNSWGWLTWHDDLSRPLGPPLGPATMSSGRHGSLFRRQFSLGVNVSLWTDVGNASIGNLPKDCVGCIEWADGSQTGTCPPHSIVAE